MSIDFKKYREIEKVDTKSDPFESYKWAKFVNGASRKFLFRKNLETRMNALRARSFKHRSQENKKSISILIASIVIVFSLIIFTVF